jgi:hypothetical protein
MTLVRQKNPKKAHNPWWESGIEPTFEADSLTHARDANWAITQFSKKSLSLLQFFKIHFVTRKKVGLTLKTMRNYK